MMPKYKIWFSGEVKFEGEGGLKDALPRIHEFESKFNASLVYGMCGNDGMNFYLQKNKPQPMLVTDIELGVD